MYYFSLNSSKVKKVDGKILFATMNLKPTPFSIGAVRDMLTAIFYHIGLFKENLQTKFLFS